LEHPKVVDPTLDFRSVKIEDCLGRLETRIKELMVGFEPRKKTINGKEIETSHEGHKYFKEARETFKALGQEGLIEYPLQKKKDKPLEALQIYRDVPIKLKLNIIGNPLMDATILAEFVARSLRENDRNMVRLHKELLNNI
jgi:hypothetical protein